jgi:C-lobe and N-lobe beta barrels of Tf-binding protein B
MRLAHVARCVAPMSAAMLVTGCGGGGGDGPVATVVPPPAVVSQANKALLIQIPDKTTLKTAGVTPSSGQAVKLTRDANGNLTKIDTSGTLNNGVTAPSVGLLTLQAQQPVPGGVASAYAGTSGVVGDITQTYSSYGLLFQGQQGGSQFFAGGYHAGTETALSSMPKNVKAKYIGGFAGVAGIELNGVTQNVDAVSGDSTVNADFGSGKVDGRVTNMIDTNDAPTNLDVTMNGKISGAGYTGTANLVDATTNKVIGTTQSSALNGSFYGPGAAETAAAVSVVTKLPPNANVPGGGSIFVVGGLGGKKQ